tara:strand:+ start:4597 stop:4836 length:240 start_codon:yes stop_codon:yes gene_type:complete
MPQLVLDRGLTANYGPGQVPGVLQIIGVGASYTIAIAGAPATAHVIAPSAVDSYPIDGQAVTVVNTSAAAGPPNLTLSY